MRLILLGPPGAGKGTLAGLIKTNYKLMHISTGDLLRAEMKSGSALGKDVQDCVDKGNLVPDETVIQLIENTLVNSKETARGFMLDGFPRTINQAKDLDVILGKLNLPIECALYMETNLPMIITRLTGRRVCRGCGAVYHIKNRPSKQEGVCDQCGGELYQRADDNEETIRNRMDVYMKSTMPIIEYYQAQDKLIKVNGDLKSEDLLNQLADIFNDHSQSHQDKNAGRA